MHTHTQLYSVPVGTVAGVLVHVIAACAVSEVDILIIVAAQWATSIVRVHQACDVTCRISLLEDN